MPSVAVSVKELTRHFSIKDKDKSGGWFRRPISTEYLAVDRLSFDIETGEKVAFIGPNGAGKSTTLKMLCGLLRPSSGSAEVCGYIPWEQTRLLARHIGLVFGQRSHLWPSLAVEHSFDLLSKIYDIEPRVYLAQRSKLIDVFGISLLLRQQAKTLSLGQRMRCDLAAALLHKPTVLFLDEPTIGLDVNAKSRMRDHLNSISNEFDTTIILTSHDTDDIERICDRVIIIDKGKKIIDSSLLDMRSNYSGFKNLTLITEEISPMFVHDGVVVVGQSNHRLSLSVDINFVSPNKIIEKCLSEFNVLDISIENKSLEQIIKEINSGGIN